MTQKNPGFLVLSLDFELHWGMFDKVTIDDYGDHYKGVRQAIPDMLALFAEHNIHATWATVGLLMHESKTELQANLPRETKQPRYKDAKLSAYHHLSTTHVGHNEKDDPYHFAPTLVQEIVDTPGQELASHTFSHYYCRDGAENDQAIFAADIAHMQAVCEKFGVTPTSIVFPRNQHTAAAVAASAQHGYSAYRGTEDHFLYRGGTEKPKLVRALRFLDAYVNISGHHTHTIVHDPSAQIHNIPSSRFLRPYNHRLRHFEALRMRRIKKAMTAAALRGEVFHLWWHPHNFGTNRKENMDNLRSLINHFESLKEAYGMESRNMRELAVRASTDNN